jgi:hypothetical protein
MDFFLRGHLDKHIYSIPPKIIKDFVERHNAAVTEADANMLSHV